MFQKLLKKTLFSLSFLMMASSFCAQNPVLDQLRTQYLGRIPAPKLEIAKTPTTPSLFKQLKDFFFEKPTQYSMPVADANRQRFLWDGITPFISTETDSINLVMVEGLNLIANPFNQACTIQNALGTAITSMGSIFTSLTLSQSISDVAKLTARQNTISYLDQHPEVRKEIQEHLTVIAEHEKHLIELWALENDAYFNGLFLSALYKKQTNGFRNKLERSSLYQNFWDLYGYYNWATFPFGASINTALFLYGKQKFYDKDVNTPSVLKFYPDLLRRRYETAQYVVGGQWLTADIKNTILNGASNTYLYMRENPLKSVGIGLLGTYAVVGGIGGMLAGSRMKNRAEDLIHEKMFAIAHIIRSMRAISDILLEHPVLNRNLEMANSLHKYFDTKGQVSSKMQEVVRLLETNTFDNASRWSLRGRVRASYLLLQDVKHELFEGLAAVGAIDMYCMVADTLSAHKNSEKPYAFATYITDSATPVINVEGVWHPLVNGTVVKNSIVLGENEYPRNVILTGPNAGGKTTFLKSIALSVVLGQTLGIVPAVFMTFTPFDTINTYMSVVDNIANGDSLFKAEAQRAGQLMKNTMANHEVGKLTFTIIDELFSGTHPRVGTSASYAAADSIGKMNTSITLISTHFIEVMSTLEEKTSYYKNYKVDATIQENGKINYPFTVTPGVSTVSVVQNMFEDLGFDADLIKTFNDQMQESEMSAAV